MSRFAVFVQRVSRQISCKKLGQNHRQKQTVSCTDTYKHEVTGTLKETTLAVIRHLDVMDSHNTHLTRTFIWPMV